MAPMRAARPALACASLLALGALAAGCGGGGGDSTATPPPVAPSIPAPPKSDFPAPEGRTLRQLIKDTDAHSELAVSPAASVFYPGVNRYSFGVAEKDGGQVNDAEVALYYAAVPQPKPGAKSAPGNKGQAAKAEEQALDQPAVGPFPARIESLGTKAAFVSQGTAEAPDSAGVIYVADLPFPRGGQWRVAAVIREGDETEGTLLIGANVGEFTHVPRPGDPAPQLQNAQDYADALGKEPILLLFATPRFCQSRVCGPVIDVAEQAKQEFGDKAAFIHMETFNENDPDKGVRPEVRAFHLPTEPWLFAINREGIVSAAVEGAFGLESMDEVAEKVIAE
jgi:hypothetical protein